MKLTKDAPTDAPNVAELDSGAETLDEVSTKIRVTGSLGDDPRVHGSDHGT